ncbi:monocarboxylate transporter 12-like [Watersipora subatra]|uniref:monocarboxylate transporter 12-like n=1 Tax=Watersipora subatra TaxID=2589382 RepID=UPI00355C3977
MAQGIPPDGGYGWVICFTAFLMHFLLDGVANSFAIYLRDYQQYFDTTVANISLANALLCGVVIIQGLGYGMMILPAVIELGYYFEKKRAIAMGIATAGAGVGMMVMAPIIEYIHKTMDWRGAHWIYAGLLIHGCALGALLKPLNTTRCSKAKENVEVTKLNEPATDTLLLTTKNREQSKSTGALVSDKSSHVEERLYASSCVNQRFSIQSEKDNFKMSSLAYGGSFYHLSLQSFAKDEEKDNDSLKRKKEFVLFGIGNIFCTVGYFYPIIYLPVRAQQLGISKEESSFLISVFATFVSLVIVVTCTLVGVEKFASAFGLIMLGRGIAVIIGPPIGGMHRPLK